MISSRPPISSADLAEWRQRNHISLPEIAEATKISVRYLEAIERGDFKSLPGGAYSLSYLRQYADAINYDADYLIECFHDAMAAYEASTPVPRAGVTWTGRIWDRIRSLRPVAGPSGILHPRS
jgi:transcriptional regulator with XRE-family HTH domain